MNTAVLFKKGYFKLTWYFFSRKQRCHTFSPSFLRSSYFSIFFTRVKLLAVKTQSRLKRAVTDVKLDKARRLTSIVN